MSLVGFPTPQNIMNGEVGAGLPAYAGGAGEAEESGEPSLDDSYVPMTYTPPSASESSSIDSGIDGFLANAESLTPEALFIYCATQLKSLDGDIKAFMNNQKLMNAKKKILQDLKTKIEQNTLKDKPDTDTRSANIQEAYKQAYNEMKQLGAANGIDMTDDLQALEGHFKELYTDGDLAAFAAGGPKPSTSNNDLAQTESSWNGWMGQLSDKIDDIGKNAELNMIQLQSIMSQRQTAIQLTTNMLDKYNKGLDQIAANYK